MKIYDGCCWRSEICAAGEEQNIIFVTNTYFYEFAPTIVEMNINNNKNSFEVKMKKKEYYFGDLKTSGHMIWSKY